MTRVVVTGLGLATPLGADRESTWAALLAGRAGDACCPLPPDDSPRAAQLARAAAQEAWSDAGFDAVSPDLERTGCVVSCSKPLLFSFPSLGLEKSPPPSLFQRGEVWRHWQREGLLDIIQPGFVPQAVARAFGLEGPVMNLSSACATGAHSVMAAAGWIREGRCDVALAGAAESSLHPLYLSGFDQLGVLSPHRRTRPFDRGRDGFLVGEGAGVFVLEELESARRRDARIYGEIAGADFACDAHHATRFNSDGQRMAGTLRRALDRSGAGQLDYVNAHGTATPLNDRLEARALLSLFGGDAPPVSSTKAATGHLLGAAGAVELAFCLLALRDGALPPTLNLEAPETDRIDFIPQRSRRAPTRAAASLSYGFGGAMAAVVVAKP